MELQQLVGTDAGEHVTAPVCEVPELFATVTHATFRQAMELLGIDIDHTLAISVGDWTHEDGELWPLAPRMREAGSFWRIRATGYMEGQPVSDATVRFIGVQRPIRSEGE